MKKVLCALIALMILVCSVAMAETIAPQFTELDTNDATYPVKFVREDIKDGVINNVHIYTMDIYDLVDISKMAVGDTFEAEGRAVTIESLETDEYGDLNINGGCNAENGYSLCTQEDINGWRTFLDNDLCTHTERGMLNLEMADDVTYTDITDIQAILNGADPLTYTGIEAVTKAIMESENDSFYADNTEIRIVNGRIAEITKRFVP